MICVSLVIANKVMIYKIGTDKYKDFYKEEEPFDVLFFGSSRVLDAFQPMELWEDYGIRSYNMAQHGESLSRDYWQLKNALEHKKTGLVVMDISAYYGLYGIDPSNEEQKGGLHKQIDHFPLSATKLSAIYDICPSGFRAEYIFPFILYHSRWNNITTYDFTSQKYKVARKGAESRNFFEAEVKPSWDDNNREETFPFEKTKIKEIIELCEEYNTNIVFVNVPSCFDPKYQGMMNYIEDYFEANSIEYINYQKNADFIDYSLDFADPDHLNTAGSIKITSAFGEYYTKNYQIYPCSEKTKNEWDEILVMYKADKDELILNETTYTGLLMLTYADDDYEVYAYTNPERFEYTGTSKFLPKQRGIEGIENYRLEIYKAGETDPLKIWEVD